MNSQEVHHDVSVSCVTISMDNMLFQCLCLIINSYTMMFQCLYYNQYGQHAVTVSMPNNQLIHYDVSVSVSV